MYSVSVLYHLNVLGFFHETRLDVKLSNVNAINGKAEVGVTALLLLLTSVAFHVF